MCFSVIKHHMSHNTSDAKNSHTILHWLSLRFLFSRMTTREGWCRIAGKFSRLYHHVPDEHTVREWSWCWRSDWRSTDSRNQEGDRSVSGRTSPTAESRSIGHLYLFFLLFFLLVLSDQTSQPNRSRCNLSNGLPNVFFCPLWWSSVCGFAILLAPKWNGRGAFLVIRKAFSGNEQTAFERTSAR